MSHKRRKTIEKYLNIQGKPAPYYLHKYDQFNFFPRRVFIGKGTPEEIGVAIHHNPNGIGIDCSGFVCHVFASTQPIRSLIRYPSSNFLAQLRFLIRPIENINVKVLIHPINVYSITLVTQIESWDLIHIDQIHIMLIYHVEKNIIYYAHASKNHREVICGEILLIDHNESLGYQQWSDPIYQLQYRAHRDSGVVRFRRDHLKEVAK
jgi:hypothetical protein